MVQSVHHEPAHPCSPSTSGDVLACGLLKTCSHWPDKFLNLQGEHHLCDTAVTSGLLSPSLLHNAFHRPLLCCSFLQNKTFHFKVKLVKTQGFLRQWISTFLILLPNPLLQFLMSCRLPQPYSYFNCHFITLFCYCEESYVNICFLMVFCDPP